MMADFVNIIRFHHLGIDGFHFYTFYLMFEIIPSQMEVAPLHCTVDIRQKRRLFKNTKEIEKM